MRVKYFLTIIVCTIFLFGSQRSFKIKSKYQQSHLRLIDKWIFISMETVTQTEKEEKEIVYQDRDNVETLSFHRSGSMSFVSVEGGKEKKGRGIWLIKDHYIRIIAQSDTIDATYNIKDDILTLTTSEEESEDFYGYTSVVKYKKK
ncbi:MAG: hypothetical protein CMG55_06295 [Candidatus Marinimicrobia bacterium]|nr:hypothetical protein [Candidatus Neomarinimicrobiota bacterium]|tara:strand:+ start:238 stop:675 length:438 start_codon:yes stop_codon:yes gene_type:complete